MRARIEVEMEETTCGECPCKNGDEWGYACNLFGFVALGDADIIGEVLRCPACLAKYGTGGQPDLRARMEAEPTGAMIADTCLSFRHDYGLMGPEERKSLEWEAAEWLRAWKKTLGVDGPPTPDPRDAVVEAARKHYIDTRAGRHGETAVPVSCGCEICQNVAALDAEGGKG